MTKRKKLNWLITGGNGFIGRNLIYQLRHKYSEYANKISIMDSCISNHKFMGNNNVEVLYMNILDASTVKYLCDFNDVDVMVHLAANTGIQKSVENPKYDGLTNVIGTISVLEGARSSKIPNVIVASSGAVTGESTPPITETTPTNPISPYGVSKLATEAYARAYAHTYDMSTAALRFSNVFGPYSENKTSVVSSFIKQVIKDNRININGTGLQTRDFIYVTDLVNTIILLSQTQTKGEIFQVCTGKETSILYLAVIIQQIFREEYNMKPTIYHNDKPMPGEIMNNYADNSKISAYLKWSPSVSLDNGLRYTIKYFLGLEE